MRLTLAPILLLAASAAVARALPAQDSTAAVPRPPAPVLPAGPTVPVDRVVAIVGPTPILWSQVQERIQIAQGEGKQPPTDSVAFVKYAREFLDAIVSEELLLQRAKTDKIEIAESEVSPRVEDDIKKIRSQFRTEAEYRTALKQSGFGSPEEYRRWLMDEGRRRLTQQKLYEKMRQEGKIPAAAVSEFDVDTFYRNNVDKLPRVPAQVSFRQLAVRPRPTPASKTAARIHAESLYAEIRAGADFESVAKRESMDPGSKELGGDLGWMRRGPPLDPAFEFAMTRLEPGVVSQPVESQFGYHLIRVDRVQPGEWKVRHILVRPKIDSTDVARARATADSAATAWRAGAKFDTLYARVADRDEERSVQDFPRARLPQAYQDALKDKPVGTITEPFPLDDPQAGVPKFMIVEITGLVEEHAPSVQDYRQEIRQQLAQQGGTTRFLNSLRKQTYVEIRY